MPRAGLAEKQQLDAHEKKNRDEESQECLPRYPAGNSCAELSTHYCSKSKGDGRLVGYVMVDHERNERKAGIYGGNIV